MSLLKEDTPLRTNPALHPQFNNHFQRSSSYGVIEVDLNSTENLLPPRNKNIFKGFSSLSVIGIVAVSVSVICVLGFTTFTSPGTQEDVILKAEAPGSYIDIEIPLGRLRGYTRKSRQGRDFFSFYKVPYAKPPLGELRFVDPEPAESWSGLRDVDEVAPQCIQKVKYSKIDEAGGEEDCLYANVYTPKVPGSGETVSLPTMVYTHGGGFAEGNGSRYGAEYFMDEDIVVVTYEWRLGALGFINFDRESMAGNQGLKDQIQILRWVRDNIASFGGDPSRVTIFGNSGGSMSIGLQMVSPLGQGLFHRAISQSGVLIGTNADMLVDNHPEITLSEIAKAANCREDNGRDELISCLRSVNPSDLALIRGGNIIYGLNLESEGSANAFMTDNPFTLMRAGKVNNVPYIVGVNNGEWVNQATAILSDPQLTDELNVNFSKVAGPILNVELSEEELSSVKQFYFGEKEIGNDTLRNLTNLVSDRSMVYTSYLAARFHGDVSNTYLYYLTKPPALSYADKANPGFPAKELGYVAHADELQFLFLYDGYPEITSEDAEYFQFSEYFVKLWANFAATGNPTMNGNEWRKAGGYKDVNSPPSFWFEIGDNSGETTEPTERMQFWDQFTLEQLKYSA